MITFAKGVNSGAVPMGGVIVRKGIYDAFMKGPEHGHRALPRLHLFRPSARLRGGARDARTSTATRSLFERARALEPVWADAVHVA